VSCSGSRSGKDRQSCLIGTGDWNARVRVLENVVLSTIQKVIKIVVKRRGIGAFEHIVPFGLVPIEGLLSTIGAVAWDSVGLAVGWVCPTATSKVWSGKTDGRSSVDGIALESVHVHLL